MHDAPRNHPVGVPLENALRPYFVLETEPWDATRGSRFEGWWVAVWRSTLPCLQIERARTLPVGRTLSMQRQGDGEAVRRALSDAAFFLTARTGHLRDAAAAGVPTIYVADGRREVAPPPPELSEFDPRKLQVLRSPTNFRRDLCMRDLNAAIERFAPGSMVEDHSESSRCRDRLMPWLRGNVADLGHGGHKILPRAVGVDFFKYDPWDWIGDVRDLWFFADDSFDSVYSSHCLEDLWHPHQALEEWTRILKPGGHLSLYLPLRDFYPNVGTPGANPGHKDDYVPEDVESFLQDLGHMEILRSERREEDVSFEVIAEKKARRSFSVTRDKKPAPAVSVLVVGEVGERPDSDSLAVCTTIEAAHASLGDVRHEILMSLRGPEEGDELAAVRDLAARLPACEVIRDRRPLPLPERWERLRRRALGRHVVVLQAGTVPAGDCLRRLHLHAESSGAAMTEPALVTPWGTATEPIQAPGSCLLLTEAAWPAGGLTQSPFHTPLLWEALRSRHGAELVPDAIAITDGQVDRPVRARGSGPMRFDEELLLRGADPTGAEPVREVLFVVLRTLGDCVLALPTLDAARRRWPDARITVLTEAVYAFLFRHHPAVSEIIAAPSLPNSELFWEEDRLLLAVLSERAFDRLVLLSDRLDSVSYHHNGRTLREYYALQGGCPEARNRPARIHLSAEGRTRWESLCHQLGLQRPYAVMHTRAGWADKTPSIELFESLCTELHDRYRLPIVVVGGPGETLDHPAAIPISGAVPMEVSAAAIAGARVFVGPDSGPLHIASAFGVPALALYGGSHLRVAPPTSPSSIAVQSPNCCSVPCGITPCPESLCGAGGLDESDVIERLREVVEGRVEHAEWWGNDPAVLVEGPEGPVLWRTGEGCGQSADLGRFFGRLATKPEAVPPEVPRAGTSQPAPLLHFHLPLDEQAQQHHKRLWLERNRMQGAPSDPGPVVSAARSMLSPIAGIGLLQTLALQCLRAQEHAQALRYICAALGQCGLVVKGLKGRRRPAFKQVANRLLHEAARIALPKDQVVEYHARLLEIFREEIGAHPDPYAALAMVRHIRELADPSHRYAGLVMECIEPLLERPQELNHAAVLELATALQKLGRLAEAEQLLAGHLDRLPGTARRENAEARFLRGNARAREQDKLAGALEDMEFAASWLEKSEDRERAERIAALIRKHLTVSSRA